MREKVCSNAVATPDPGITKHFPFTAAGILDMESADTEGSVTIASMHQNKQPHVNPD